MQLDQFILRLVILLIPGVAGYKVYKQLRSTGRTLKQFKDWEDFLNVLLFSLVGYLILWAGAAIINFLRDLIAPLTHSQLEVYMLRALLDVNVQPNYLEILLAVVVAVLLGIGAAWVSNKKWPFKFFKTIKVTNHFGDDDVWSFIMNSDDVFWVVVRDHKVDLAYVARIELFSDSGEKRELVLVNVDVRDNKNWKLLYKAERLYISRNDDDLSIEILSSTRKERMVHGKGPGRRNEASK